MIFHQWCNGKCYKNTAFLERLVRFILYLYSLNTRLENTAFHFWVILLYSVTLASVRISVSHAHGCQGFCLMIGLQFKSGEEFPDGLLELKGVMIFCMNALPLLSVTFTSQPFTSLVLHIDPVPLSILRCWCIKSMFLVLSNRCTNAHEKHSYKGPIINVLYFSNIKNTITSQNLLIYVYVWKDGYDIE